ncbi:MAG TPA: hypothetical protein VLQ78_04490 [Ornithinibacter sp.]|nr:hypothetical protein [Ornithinibacter sp.]
MPSTTKDHADAPGSADAPLLRGLVDDAAVFPPAAVPLPMAVRAHAAHRNSAYAAAVGPLLVPASGVADLVAVLEEEAARAGRGTGDAALDVVLVARPGAEPTLLTAGVDALHEEPRVRVVGAELAWHDGWRELGLDDLAVALEVPRGDDHDAALADIRAAVHDGRRVVAKLRTGPTPTWPWPDEDEVAAFLVMTNELGVPFKLTGGLHHAVRGTYEAEGVPEENHGLLNVLLATSAARSGAGREEVAALLALRDGAALAELVAAWPDATASRVRESFTAYGCCTVTDPLGELATLGLLDAF